MAAPKAADRTERHGRTEAPAAEASAARSRSPEGIGPKALSRDLVQHANGDIAAFIVALNAAGTKLDPITVEELRDATDRLLQSCARTRLEIERMFPLATQDQPREAPRVRHP